MEQKKQISNGVDTPKYVDYNRFFSVMANRRVVAALRKNAEYMLRPGYIKMGGGFPNPLMFPVLTADFQLRDGSVIHIDEKQMETHLQYGLSQGYPDLREWVMEFQRKVHSPPTLQPDHPGHFDVVLTNGSNEGLNLAFEMLLSEGDWVLVEEATYATALSMVAPLGAKVESVRTDNKGMIPQDLTRILTSWNELHPGCPKPKTIYAVASGGNPTGVSWSLARKRTAYDIARSHDLIILEDEAYYFLQFSRPLIPSFLSLDVDGRVLRFDTFSKLVAPGLRVAVVTGPAPFLAKLRITKDVGTVGPSGLAQAMLVQLLRHYGHDGFLRHLDSVMEFYKQKAEMAVECAERHLSGLAEWTTPSGGMFLWLRVLGLNDSQAVCQRALNRHLIVVCGTHFQPGSEIGTNIRISYGSTNEKECDEGFRILAELIREEVAAEQSREF